MKHLKILLRGKIKKIFWGIILLLSLTSCFSYHPAQCIKVVDESGTPRSNVLVIYHYEGLSLKKLVCSSYFYRAGQVLKSEEDGNITLPGRILWRVPLFDFKPDLIFDAYYCPEGFIYGELRHLNHYDRITIASQVNETIPEKYSSLYYLSHTVNDAFNHGWLEPSPSCIQQIIPFIISEYKRILPASAEEDPQSYKQAIHRDIKALEIRYSLE